MIQLHTEASNRDRSRRCAERMPLATSAWRAIAALSFALGAMLPGGAALADTPLTGVAGIAAGRFHTCAVLTSGLVKCWGSNGDGRLGNGEAVPASIPFPYPEDVVFLTGAVAVAAGGQHTCAIDASGNAKCWGENLWGQVGNGEVSASTPVPYPVDVVIAPNLRARGVAAGTSHSCAVVRVIPDEPYATLVCWGYGEQGQLGDGNLANSPIPVGVSPLPGSVKQGVAGYGHTCILVDNGNVSCTGDNTYGQLGSVYVVEGRPSPVPLPGPATHLAAGADHTCAVLQTGDVQCWGWNYWGQLGSGTAADSGPVTVGGVSGATRVAAGIYHSCAIVAGGTVKCWGGNDYGQLGDGSTTPSRTPVTVTGVRGATELAAGYEYTCALLADGTVRCWGQNYLGQLGNGATASASPVATTVVVRPTLAATATALAASANPIVYGQSVTLTATVTGGASPTGTVRFQADGADIAGCASVALASGEAQCTSAALGAGARALTAVYGGDAGNAGSTGTLALAVDKATVNIAVIGHAPDPSVAMAPVTVTIALNVVAPGAGTPTGTVAVARGSDGCNIALPATSCAFTPNSVGADNIGAQYAGDANFNPSTAAPVAHTTTAIAQAITFAALPNRTLGDPPFTLSAAGGASGNPVTFASGTSGVCTVAGDTVTLIAAGPCTITANQAGNALYAPAPQVAQSFSVARANALVLLASSVNPSVAGQAVTFTLAASGSAGTPAGTVTFVDGAATLCSAVVLDGSGTAACTTSALTGGARTIAADYSGDPKYLPASAAIVQNVTAAAGFAIADVDYPAVLETEVRALNDNGQITGVAMLAGTPTPFAYTAGAYSPLPPLPAPSGLAAASPWGISGAGTVVGGAYDSAAAPTLGKGFTLTAGAYSFLSRAGFPMTEVRGANAAGTLVGWAHDPVATTAVAFLYDPATTTFTDIAVPAPGWRKIAHGINAAGQVVGSVDDGTVAHGFLREASGTVSAFQVNGLPTYARGINDAGVIAGYVLSGGVAQGFVGNAGLGFQMLNVPGAAETVAQAINNAGQVAGYWRDAQGHRHGFIATPGQLPVGVTTTGGFKFDVAVVGGQPVFIDPAVAVGYDYAIGTGDPLFQSVRLPIGFGDSLYMVTAGGASVAVPGGKLHDLRSAANPAGVPAFRVTGIEPTAYVDPADPRGFPTEVTFAASGRFTGTQTPIVANVPWPTTMSFTSSPNPASAGQRLTLTATVASPGGTPTGNVVFADGKRTPALCSAELSAGRAQCELHPLSVGVHEITASYVGNPDYATVSQTLTQTVKTPASGKSPQTITFPALPDRTTLDPPFLLNASASSGLPVTFASATAAVCTVTGATVVLTRTPGTCTITASQGGNAKYEAAPPATRSFKVTRSAQATAPPAIEGQ